MKINKYAKSLRLINNIRKNGEKDIENGTKSFLFRDHIPTFFFFTLRFLLYTEKF
jgi:hypothetical protein